MGINIVNGICLNYIIWESLMYVKIHIVTKNCHQIMDAKVIYNAKSAL